MRLDPRLLNEAGKRRPPFILSLGLGLMGGLFSVLQARYLSWAIDGVFLKKQSFQEIQGLVFVMLLVILLRAVTAWGSEVAAGSVAAVVKLDLRARLYAHIAALGPSYTAGERSGELANTLMEGIESLEAYFGQYLPQLALAALVPLTVLIFVFPIDLISGLVLLLTAPLIPIFMILIGSLAEALTRKQWLSLSRMNAYFLDVLQGLTTLKILGRSREQARVINQLSERYRDVTMRVLRVAFLSALTLELIATLSTAVVAVEIGLRLLYGQMAFVQALFILILAPEFYLPLRLLGTRFHAGMAGFEAAQRIFPILSLPAVQDETQEAAGMVKHQPHGISNSGSIVFKDVAFQYPDDRAALTGADFSINPGSLTALVGPSGSGKSTVAWLLLRFLEPQAGLILTGDTDLKEIPPDAWRRQVAWVPQKPTLFKDTIAANLCLARPDATSDELMQAASQAGIGDFIHSLPLGYDTMLGEGGATLSGGQAQQIAIARAFLKNAPLLILDEPSSSLDPETEDELQKAIQGLAQSRTTLVIAHRLATVRNADCIVVLDHGKVVQIGRHADLLNQPGIYQELVDAWGDRSGDLHNASPEPDANSMPARYDLAAPGSSAGLPEMNTIEPAIAIPEPLAPFQSHGRLSNSAVLMRLGKLAWPFSGLILLSTLSGFATVGSGIGLMAVSAYIISLAALHPSVAALQVAIVGVRFFGLSRGIFRYVERYTSHQVTFHILARLRVWFYQALEPLAPARLFAFHSGDLANRLTGDIAALENFYVRGLEPPLTACLVAIMMVVYLQGFNPVIAWTLLGFLGAGGIGIPWVIGRLSQATGRQIVDARRDLNIALVDGLQGLPELLSFGQARRQHNRIVGLSRRLGLAQRRMAHFFGVQIALSLLAANLGMLVVLILAVPLVSAGRLPGFYLAVITLASLASFEAIQPLPLAAQYLESSLQSARRLFEIVDASPDVAAPPDPLPLPAEFNLEAHDLTFSYPAPSDNIPVGEKHWKLSLDQFSLPAGKRLGLVGPTGSGKTTLVNLLLRFWEYQNGSILLDGHELRQYDPDNLRGRIAVVAQPTHLFNATLRENILLGSPKASQALIEQAASQAQLDDFILSLPRGYDTWIGEGGLRLSAGERQRVAIARALLKNAPLLILDEPTANLDTVNERLVLEAIRVLMEGRTTLMITHRLVGMLWMDEILVLKNGSIFQRGTHLDLLQAGGLYKRMWDLQSQRVRNS